MSVAMQEIADVGMMPVGKSAPVETTINYHARTIQSWNKPKNAKFVHFYAMGESVLRGLS